MNFIKKVINESYLLRKLLQVYKFTILSTPGWPFGPWEDFDVKWANKFVDHFCSRIPYIQYAKTIYIFPCQPPLPTTWTAKRNAPKRTTPGRISWPTSSTCKSEAATTPTSASVTWPRSRSWARLWRSSRSGTATTGFDEDLNFKF